MFRRLHESTSSVRITLNGRELRVAADESVAAALLTAGMRVFRHTVRSGAGRGVYCGMGVCFECLVTIDGAANRQACLVPVREGMIIETGKAAPQLEGEAKP